MTSVGLRELSRIREQLEALMERGLLESAPTPASVRGGELPPVDVAETEDAFHLSFELPGVTREEVQLHLEKGRLILTGHRPEVGGELEYLRLERSRGDFRREIDLGSAVDPETVEASLRRGVLTVRVGKRKPRAIEVRGAGEGA